ILGTAAYMSPEQARGRTVDRRTDVWAFGCVLFEMLTGTRPFEGEDTTAVLARILERQPDWRAVPAVTPAAVRTLLARCVGKDPSERLHDMADVRIQIEDVVNDPVGAAPAIPRARHNREWAAWSAAALFSNTTVNVPSFALAPDGYALVFSAE